jgi:hypothetical protein
MRLPKLNETICLPAASSAIDRERVDRLSRDQSGGLFDVEVKLTRPCRRCRDDCEKDAGGKVISFKNCERLWQGFSDRQRRIGYDLITILDQKLGFIVLIQRCQTGRFRIYVSKLALTEVKAAH